MNTTWHVGEITITRVLYLDTPIPAELIGLETTDLSSLNLAPWVTDGQPAIGLAFWVVESAGRVIVVDPCGAADAFIRSGEEAVTHQDTTLGLLTAAGFEPGLVDALVLSHLDGIGMAAVVEGDGWQPTFANAAFVVSDKEVEFVAATDWVSGRDHLLDFVERGLVTQVEAPHELAPGVTLRHTGGHSPGHCVIEIESADVHATFAGHLAVSPLHSLADVWDGRHVDDRVARDAFDEVLATAADKNSVIFGSLWPSPGAARVEGGALVPSPGLTAS